MPGLPTYPRARVPGYSLGADGFPAGRHFEAQPNANRHDDDDEPTDWDDIDLEDMFDLPPVLPPVRLPEEAELAVQARQSALLADLRALAEHLLRRARHCLRT